MSFVWTPTNTSLLIQRWTEGISAKKIAQELDTTKNSVVSKVHRLGLPKRQSPIARTVETSPEPATPKEAKPEAVKPKPKIPVQVPKPKPVEIELPETDNPQEPVGCRMIIGDPKKGEDWRYCQHEQVKLDNGQTSSYCAHHHARCYKPYHKEKKKAADLDRAA